MNMQLETRLCGIALIILGIIMVFIDNDITTSILLWMLGIGCLVIPSKYIK